MIRFHLQSKSALPCTLYKRHQHFHPSFIYFVRFMFRAFSHLTYRFVTGVFIRRQFQWPWICPFSLIFFSFSFRRMFVFFHRKINRSHEIKSMIKENEVGWKRYAGAISMYQMCIEYGLGILILSGNNWFVPFKLTNNQQLGAFVSETVFI